MENGGMTAEGLDQRGEDGTGDVERLSTVSSGRLS